MYQIDQSKQVEVLRWLMYAWDGQWLGRTAAVYGPAEASKINTRVRSAFAKIEMKALLALLGKKHADNLPDAAEMLKVYFDFAFGERGFVGQFKPAEAGPTGHARLQVEVTRLTPTDALKKAAQAAGENPANACEMLWNTWLETLLPDANIQVTLRSSGNNDLYQIDSLGESFNPASLPVVTPAVAAPAVPSIPVPPAFAVPAPVAPAPVAPAAVPLPPFATAAPVQATPTPIENRKSEIENPIASVLQIPMEKVAPAVPPPNFDPYASGPASYAPPAAPAEPGLIGGVEAGGNARRGRITLDPSLLADTPTPVSQPMPAVPASSGDLPLPPFSTATPPALAQPAPAPVPAPNPTIDWPVPPFPAAAPQSPTPAPAPPVLPQQLTIDPNTGRPLFGNDLESEAKYRADRSKVKNPNLLSRMMLSKQARELIANTADDAPKPTLSIAASINQILQRRLAQARAYQPALFSEPVQVLDGPQGDLQIYYGAYVYYGVDELPEGPVKDVLRQSVQEWSESQ